jgi:hypothetical protein
VSLSALTNLNGQYSFTGLNPGVYSITQTVPGTFNSEADFLGALGGNLSSPVLIDQIVITGGQTGDNYNFLDQHPVTQQTSSISGTVTEQLNPGDAFVPAEGVNVLLEDSEGNVVASTTTDANGNYIFNNVTAGPGIIYTVFFANPDPTTLRGANTVDVDMSVDPTNATGVDGAFSALLV